MNCQTCGAKNDDDALFCAECGTPLENQDIEATIAGQVIDVNVDDDSDRTIMSTSEDLAAEAKTGAVDYARIAAAMAEEETPAEIDDPFDPASLGPPPVPMPSTGETPAPAEDLAPAEIPVAAPAVEKPVDAEGESGGSKKTMWIIIGVVLFVLALCCCCASVGIGSILADPDILNDLGSLPNQILVM